MVGAHCDGAGSAQILKADEEGPRDRLSWSTLGMQGSNGEGVTHHHEG